MTLPVTFTLTSPSTQAAAPFVIGQAFKKGDVPAGSSVAVTGATAQVTPKNAWPDGSLKFAIIAGTASLTANTPATVTLSVGSASTGTALTLADLKATGITASIGAGAFGSASWSDTDWDSPFQWAAGQTAWVSGHRMSSWLYRKQIGSDAHLVGWLEVRLFAGGAVEVLPWVENGYLRVASPVNKSDTYSFTLGGGAARYSGAIDLPNHCRTPLLSGSVFSYWLGATAYHIIPKHDTAYLQSTRMVPKYRGNVSTSATVLNALPTSFAPLQAGNTPSDMGAGGADSSIGLLPQWDVLYLTCADNRAYAGVIYNNYSAGRYGTHYRDEATNRPIRFSTNVYVVANDAGACNLYGASGSSPTGDVTPLTTGTLPAKWANSHHPSVGYFAYLISGKFYFLEESQFVATITYLIQNSGTGRDGAKGLLQSAAGANQTRGAAWGLRSLAQAASIAPDADVLQAEFINSFSENVNFYHTRYVAQPHNPFGFVHQADLSSSEPDGQWIERSWMQDFFVAAIGYGKALSLGISGAISTKLDAFFEWKAQSVIGRLGGTSPTEYLYRDAGIYDISVAPSDTVDWGGGAGPWYSDWGQIYQAVHGVANPGVAGDLRGGNFPIVDSYWGNLQPAIAYAVEHGVPGALDGYNRMIGAGNWNAFEAGLDTDPTWGVVPHAQIATANAAISKTYSIGSGQTLYAGRQRPVTPPPEGAPLWLQGVAVNQAVQIPGSAPSVLGTTDYVGDNNGNWIDYWSGLSIDTRSSKVYSFANGGHNDYPGNEINALDLMQDTPPWVQLLAPSAIAGNAVGQGSEKNRPYLSDGRPTSVHSYYHQQFIEARNRAARFPTGSMAGADGHPNVACASYNILTNTCDAEGTYLPNAPQTLYAEFGPVCKISDLRTGVEAGSEDVYLFNKNQAVYKWTQSTNTMSTVSLPDNYPPSAMNDHVYWASAYDPVNNRILLLNQTVFAFNLSGPNVNRFTSVALTGAAAAAVKNGGYGMVYEPVLHKFIVKTDGDYFYLIDPDTYAVTQITTTGAVGIAGTTNGIFNRFLYVPALSGVVYFPRFTSNAWFLRTH